MLKGSCQGSQLLCSSASAMDEQGGGGKLVWALRVDVSTTGQAASSERNNGANVNMISENVVHVKHRCRSGSQLYGVRCE